jgi:hypothetical protein
MEDGIRELAEEHEGYKWYAWSGRLQIVGDFLGPISAAESLLNRAVNTERQSKLGPIIYVSQRGFNYDGVAFWHRTLELAKLIGLPRLQQLGIPL